MKNLMDIIENLLDSIFPKPQLAFANALTVGPQNREETNQLFSLQFDKPGNPLSDMGLASWRKIKEWMDINNYGRHCIVNYKDKDGIYIIECKSGSIVLKDFEISRIIKNKTSLEVTINQIGGSVTILSQLSSSDIYKRIKATYDLILANCLGKSTSEQNKYLFSEASAFYILDDNTIPNSVNYIRKLPVNPNAEEMRDLCNEIKSGILEYAYHHRDIYDVEIHLYSETLYSLLGFEKQINLLYQMQPNITTKEIEELRELYLLAEKHWEYNLGRYVRDQKKPVSRQTKQFVLKYLLICEAPPESGEYFYKSTDGYLFKQVWKTFFKDEICDKPEDAYLCLLDKGFLLVDSLPYCLRYRTKDRKKPEYDQLITSYLSWWLEKLDRVTISPDLKIAMGFNLNSKSILEACNSVLTIAGQKFIISTSNRAVSGSGYPTAYRLSEIFNTQNSKTRCCQ